MAALPTGTLTFLFTDIEGSTRLLTRLGDRYAPLLERHNQLLRAAIAANDGIEVMTEGDAFFVVFRSPAAALHAAADMQRALYVEHWPDGATVRVRAGVHTGEAVLGGDNYVGLDVHRAARIAAAGHGGQVLVSDATRALVANALPDDVELRDLGEHRLKDLAQAERLYQLDVDGVPTTFPAINSLDARPNNLPTPMTSFIGREAQINEVKRRLADARLVTLTGPGGTGKTRLGVRVAEELLDEFAGGCWFVALDALRDPELVPSAIAAALNIGVPGDRPVVDALESWLADKQLLLVLDNFEQVSAAAPHIGRLLAAAPRLRVLATSRTPLHLYGEVEYAVPPLASVADLRSASRSAERLSQYEAVRLFIERAIAVRPDFRVTNSNAPALAEICAQLDGLPLAIELAAARVKLLSVEQILERLQDSLRLLATSAQDRPERQRTLEGAIDWSYQMLPRAEQLLFRKLSVFRGGFTLGAAEAIVGDDEGSDVFDGIASLVDKSLVRTVDQPDEARFAMLETIRQYASDRLNESVDAAEVRRRHARHHFALALSSEAELTGAGQLAALDRLDREHHNLRAAMDRAVDLGLLDEALVAAGAAWRFWQQRGHFAEARVVFERLLAAEGASAASRARALIGAAGIAYWQGDYEVVARWYAEARQIYESIGDKPRLAEALYNEAYVPALRGDIAGARLLAERSVDLFRELGDELGEAQAQMLLSFIHYFQGDALAAVPYITRVVEIYRRSNARWPLADALTGLGFTSAMAGRWREAMPAMREAVNIFRESGNEVGVATVAQGFAVIAAWIGDHALSARLFGAADGIRERTGGGPPSQFIQTEVYRARGRAELGEEEYARIRAEGAALSGAQVADLSLSIEPADDTPPLPPPEPWGPPEAEAAAAG